VFAVSLFRIASDTSTKWRETSGKAVAKSSRVLDQAAAQSTRPEPTWHPLYKHQQHSRQIEARQFHRSQGWLPDIGVRV